MSPIPQRVASLAAAAHGARFAPSACSAAAVAHLRGQLLDVDPRTERRDNRPCITAVRDERQIALAARLPFRDGANGRIDTNHSQQQLQALHVQLPLSEGIATTSAGILTVDDDASVLSIGGVWSKMFEHSPEIEEEEEEQQQQHRSGKLRACRASACDTESTFSAVHTREEATSVNFDAYAKSAVETALTAPSPPTEKPTSSRSVSKVTLKCCSSIVG